MINLNQQPQNYMKTRFKSPILISNKAALTNTNINLTGVVQSATIYRDLKQRGTKAFVSNSVLK